MNTLLTSMAAGVAVAVATAMTAPAVGRAPVGGGATTAPSRAAFDDPIAFTGHGAAWGPDGQPITVTAAFIARAQAAYTARALQTATINQRARYDALRAYLADIARGASTPADRQSALMADSLLLDWVIETVRPVDAASLTSRNRMLVSWLRRGLGGDGGTMFSLPPDKQAIYAQLGIAPSVLAAPAKPPAAVMQARENYAKQCIKAGVPAPPTWGKTGAGSWTSAGAIASPFISPTLVAEIFYHESAKPEGICLALPRYKAAPADAPIELLGIICMGRKAVDTGSGVKFTRACFWDNQLGGVTQDIDRKAEVPLTIGFAAGDELDGGQGGVCTACHAGENAFVVHPRDAAFRRLPALEPETWYRPLIGIAGWPKNPGPNDTLKDVVLGAGDESCMDAGCHDAATKRRLPEIKDTKAFGTGVAKGSNYCDAVLRPALARTMPPPDASNAAAYKKQSDKLLADCDAAATK